jgi:prepilin-type N-terminal cleavage/methylation domain-containing protein
VKSQAGLTIVELLIALVVIGVAFTALAMSQLSSLRASAGTRLVSETKAHANQVLEDQMAAILQVDAVAKGSQYDDSDPGAAAGRSFHFIDYYYRCPSAVTPPLGTRANLRNVTCSGNVTSADNLITSTWSVVGEGGPLGEGSIVVTVSAVHQRGPRLTLLNRITCYDVYPSPTATAPKPCPEPKQSGGGRP